MRLPLALYPYRLPQNAPLSVIPHLRVPSTDLLRLLLGITVSEVGSPRYNAPASPTSRPLPPPRLLGLPNLVMHLIISELGERNTFD